MMTRWVVPSMLFFLSLLSILILRSVAPALVGRQVFFLIIGAGVFSLTATQHFAWWQRISYPLYALFLGSLAATQVLATVTRGTRSWVELGAFHIQPSQLAIGISALAIGRLVSQRKAITLQRFALILATVVSPAFLIFIEPDLGTTVIYLLATGIALLYSPIPIKYLAALMGGGVVLLLCSWLFLLKPYQKQRITSFLSVDEAPHSASYNAVQSMIAVGSGRLSGKGLGQGTQSQLRFLPERQTDFVFASFAEETGFIGGAIVIGCYATIIGICLWTAGQSALRAEQLFALITAVMFVAQVGVNIGMNIGLVPITGITLPFLSYGGSSIIALSWQLGCVQSIIGQLRPRPKRYIH